MIHQSPTYGTPEGVPHKEPLTQHDRANGNKDHDINVYRSRPEISLQATGWFHKGNYGLFRLIQEKLCKELETLHGELVFHFLKIDDGRRPSPDHPTALFIPLSYASYHCLAFSLCCCSLLLCRSSVPTTLFTLSFLFILNSLFSLQEFAFCTTLGMKGVKRAVCRSPVYLSLWLCETSLYLETHSPPPRSEVCLA